MRPPAPPPWGSVVFVVDAQYRDLLGHEGSEGPPRPGRPPTLNQNHFLKRKMKFRMESPKIEACLRYTNRFVAQTHPPPTHPPTPWGRGDKRALRSAAGSCFTPDGASHFPHTTAPLFCGLPPVARHSLERRRGGVGGLVPRGGGSEGGEGLTLLLVNKGYSRGKPKQKICGKVCVHNQTLSIHNSPFS